MILFMDSRMGFISLKGAPFFYFFQVGLGLTQQGIRPRVPLVYIFWAGWPQTPKSIPEPSHSRVFGEIFFSSYVVKSV